MEIRPLLAAALVAVLALPAHAQDEQEDAYVADYPEIAMVVDDLEGPKPIGLAYDWVSNADYPLDAWRNGEEGNVIYDLAVDSGGRVTSCTATSGSATPALKAETCRLLLERARFEPEKDDKGEPVASTYSGYHLWSRREPEFGAGNFTVTVGFTLDERGKSSNCRVIERTGTIPADMLRSFEKDPCPSGRARNPVRDAEGRPVARDVVLTLSVETAPAAVAVPGG
jgi:protein TonB